MKLKEYVKPQKYYNKMYDDYEKYFWIPVALLLLAVGVLGFNYVTTGEFVEKGTDFTGGTEVTYTIEGDFTTVEIERAFASEGRDDVSVMRQQTGDQDSILVQLPPPEIDSDEAERILTDQGYDVEVIGLQAISAAVSEEFFKQAVMAFVMAFTIMSLVIFVAFRDVVPSAAVVFAAAGDITVAVAGMTLVGIPLTLGSLAALLMLIGYSVDTDIVLSTRTLRMNRGSLKGRIWSSVKTGMTMSMGGVAGFALLYIVSWLIVGPSELTNIAGVMVIGLLADMPFTWFGNAYILREYLEGDLDTWKDFGGIFRWN